MYQVAVDFDGVLHLYDQDFTTPDEILDGIVPGAIEWLASLLPHFKVIIHTTRAKESAGRVAIHKFLVRHALEAFGSGHPLTDSRITRYPIGIVASKPAALVYVDDRAWRFQGPQDFKTLTPDYIEDSEDLKPWNKRQMVDL